MYIGFRAGLVVAAALLIVFADWALAGCFDRPQAPPLERCGHLLERYLRETRKAPDVAAATQARPGHGPRTSVREASIPGRALEYYLARR